MGRVRVERLILDTCVLVGFERAVLTAEQIAPRAADVVLPALAVGEFISGIYLAATEERRRERRNFLDRLLTQLPVVPHDEHVAEHYGELYAHTQRQGEIRGPVDLAIAATARATARRIVTTDAKARFGELPGVTARLLRQ